MIVYYRLMLTLGYHCSCFASQLRIAIGVVGFPRRCPPISDQCLSGGPSVHEL